MTAEADTAPRRHSACAAGAGTRRLAIVLVLVAGYLLAEVMGGLLTNSLALLADAEHMFTDAARIGLALLAIWFGGRPATLGNTFGFYRVEISRRRRPAPASLLG